MRKTLGLVIGIIAVALVLFGQNQNNQNNQNGLVSGNFVATGTMTAGATPGCTAGSGGGMCSSEGTAPTPLASVEEIAANSTFHDWGVSANGGVTKLLDSSVGYNSGSISASVGVTNVASAANFPTGQYILDC